MTVVAIFALLSYVVVASHLSHRLIVLTHTSNPSCFHLPHGGRETGSPLESSTSRQKVHAIAYKFLIGYPTPPGLCAHQGARCQKHPTWVPCAHPLVFWPTHSFKPYPTSDTSL